MRYAALGLAVIALCSSSGPDEIRTHDNRTPAGLLRHNVLAVDLVAGKGVWYPEGKEGPGHHVYAFGVAGDALSNPGPLLRVPAGTEIRATIRNQVPGSPLEVHGLHDRPGAPAVITVPAGETRMTRFRVTAPGTYFYWASTRGALTLRDRFGAESQLTGALVVDAPGTRPRDEVFVIGVEDDSGKVASQRRIRAAVINGRSWPHTQISSVTSGDTVRMRWINASDRMHPMHLHGFYFTVDGRGDMAQDTSYDAGRKRLAVTELMAQGQTMALTWVAERPGNWMMHCHMAAHMSPELRGRRTRRGHDMRGHNHTMEVMAGLVVGWRVLPSPRVSQVRRESEGRRRALRLLVQSAPGRYGPDPGMGFVLQEGATPPAPDSVVIPGAPLVLTRGQPVEINIVNNLPSGTSIHWHGIELESYFDGVSGWSGDQRRTAPHIEAGDSFAVRFTPPRAGTFIYHSHFDEERQLGSGLYGPLIVLEEGATFDPEKDRPWILSQAGPTHGEQLARVTLNGSREPVIDLSAGVTYRIRLINISATAPLRLTVLSDTTPIKWRAVAKDGADLPPAQATMRPARLMVGVGEAYDFELTPGSPGELPVMVTDVAGRTRLTGRIRVTAR